MKTFIGLSTALILFIGICGAAAEAQTPYYDRKDRFQVGATFPAIFFGSKNIDAMLGGAVEGEYYFLENISFGFRLQEATDFGLGGAPHSVFSMTVLARYTFDVAEDWAVYYGLGGGGALIGDSSWAGAVMPVNLGGFYQFDDHLSFGFDAGMHVYIRSNTAVGFWAGPAVRWRF